MEGARDGSGAASAADEWRGTQTPARGRAAGPAEGCTQAARSDDRSQLPEPLQHMAAHPRQGYVRTAGGYLYNSLPSLSGSASLRSTPQSTPQKQDGP